MEIDGAVFIGMIGSIGGAGALAIAALYKSNQTLNDARVLSVENNAQKAYEALNGSKLILDSVDKNLDDLVATVKQLNEKVDNLGKRE